MAERPSTPGKNNFAPFVTCDDCGGVTTRRVRNAILAGIFAHFRCWA
jgi:hypothetical protein